uniref:Uncharacterized protein n=1 Tax=viral metagenome TaxID=1070528 RepID=A0A6M3LJQ2_9ZZZZ
MSQYKYRTSDETRLDLIQARNAKLRSAKSLRGYRYEAYQKVDGVEGVHVFSRVPHVYLFRGEDLRWASSGMPRVEPDVGKDYVWCLRIPRVEFDKLTREDMQ